MADAGADLIVAHMGVTTGGTIGARSSKTLDDCVDADSGHRRRGSRRRKDVLVICHGGPISEPPDAEYIITNCRGVDGFYGASSVERLPAERAIAEQIRTFKAFDERATDESGQRSSSRHCGSSPRKTRASSSHRGANTGGSRNLS